MSFFSKIPDFLFPERCLICGERDNVKDSLCSACHGKYVSEAFEHCGSCDKNASRCSCGSEFTLDTRTKVGDKYFSTLTFYSNASHRSGTDRITEKLIFALKSRGYFARFFAGELGRMIRNDFMRAGLDLSEWTLTYVPRSVPKFIESGIDQGDEVTRYLAKTLCIKRKSVFFRAVSEEQKSLTREERAANAEETIHVRRRSVRRGEKFLLFDDIITSGATMSAAARLLYGCGAAEVYPISVARTLR